MRPRFQTVSTPLLGLLALAVALPSAGCDPVSLPRVPVADTTRLFSLARAEHQNAVSALDLTRPPRTLVLETPGNPETFDDFDIAFSELDGDFVFLPAGVFEGLSTTPGLVRIEDRGFDALERAPGEGYTTDAALPLQVGDVFAARSRNHRGCRYYGKIEVLDLDPAGIVQFRFLANNLCNDRVLTEPDDD